MAAEPDAVPDTADADDVHAAGRDHDDAGPGADVIAFPTATPPHGIRDAVGSVLRAERARQDRTLADVAHEAGVSLPYLSEIERGRKDASAEVVESVCRALELPVADLLERAARGLRAGAQRAGRFELLAA